MVHYALAHHYPGRAQSLLEQAAKECGGAFDQNRRDRDAASSADGEAPATHAKPARRGARKVYGMAQLPESR